MPNTLKHLAFSVMLAAWTALPATPAMSDPEAPVHQSAPPVPQGNNFAGRYDPDPESGTIVGDAYTNAYFALSLPLPPGWTEGLAGPPPSAHGLYVLSAMDGTKVSRATLLIVAQDLFFNARPLSTIADMATDFRSGMAGIPDLAIGRPADITIGGRAFLRLDYNAGGLYRAWLATELRCHVVSFNITSTDQATADRIAGFLDAMSLPAQSETLAGGVSDSGRTPPMCIKDYVTAQTTVRRVEPVMVDPAGLTVTRALKSMSG